VKAYAIVAQFAAKDGVLRSPLDHAVGVEHGDAERKRVQRGVPERFGVVSAGDHTTGWVGNIKMASVRRPGGTRHWRREVASVTCQYEAVTII